MYSYIHAYIQVYNCIDQTMMFIFKKIVQNIENITNFMYLKLEQFLLIITDNILINNYKKWKIPMDLY